MTFAAGTSAAEAGAVAKANADEASASPKNADVIVLTKKSFQDAFLSPEPNVAWTNKFQPHLIWCTPLSDRPDEGPEDCSAEGLVTSLLPAQARQSRHSKKQSSGFRSTNSRWTRALFINQGEEGRLRQATFLDRLRHPRNCLKFRSDYHTPDARRAPQFEPTPLPAMQRNHAVIDERVCLLVAKTPTTR